MPVIIPGLLVTCLLLVTSVKPCPLKSFPCSKKYCPPNSTCVYNKKEGTTKCVCPDGAVVGESGICGKPAGYTTTPPTLTVGDYANNIFKDVPKERQDEWEKQAEIYKKLRQECEIKRHNIITKLKPASDAAEAYIKNTIKENIEEAAKKRGINISNYQLEQLVPEQKEGDIIVDSEEYYHELEPEFDRVIITVAENDKDATLTNMEQFIKGAPLSKRQTYGETYGQTYGQAAAKSWEIEKTLKDFGQIIVSCPRNHSADLMELLKDNFANDQLRNVFTDYAMQVTASDCARVTVGEPLQQTDSNKITMWYKDMADGKQDGSYEWESGAEGKNTIVYVIDTGVMAQHPEFEGRVMQGPDFCPPKINASRPCTKHDDIYNHGTPISALIVGKTFGMAKQAQVMNVKCSDDRGGMFFSELIQCMEWAMRDSHRHIAAGKRVIFSISQTSMDSSGQKKASFEHLFKTFTNLGIVTVVAAGNFIDQACSFTPGNVGADTLTVGSIEQFETSSSVKADHSNYGTCVDMYAPGMHVQTLHADGTVVSLHGTSFATPIVAALVANYLSKNNGATAVQVYKYFKEVAVEDFAKEQEDFVLSHGQWVEGLEWMYHEIFGPFRRIKFPCPMP